MLALTIVETARIAASFTQIELTKCASTRVVQLEVSGRSTSRFCALAPDQQARGLTASNGSNSPCDDIPQLANTCFKCVPAG